MEYRTEKPPSVKDIKLDHLILSSNLLELLDDVIFPDVIFIVGENSDEIKAHKSILSARSVYFKAMFREGGMMESREGRVVIDGDFGTFKRTLE